MRYPFKIRPDGRFFLVTFPDIPEAITQGETMEQAIEVAQDALETAVEFYFEGARAVPEPSPVKRGGHFVELPASLTCSSMK
jgi:antitoxin HicB